MVESLKIGLIISAVGAAKTVGEIIALRQSVEETAEASEAFTEALGTNSEEAEKLRAGAAEADQELKNLGKSLNLSPDQVIAVAETFERMQASGASNAEIQAELNRQYGLSKAQVKDLGTSLEKVKGGGLGGLADQGKSFLSVLLKIAVAVGGVVLAVKALEKFAPEVYEQLSTKFQTIASGAQQKAQQIAQASKQAAVQVGQTAVNAGQAVGTAVTTKQDGSKRGAADYIRAAQVAGEAVQGGLEGSGGSKGIAGKVLFAVSALRTLSAVAGTAETAVEGISTGKAGGGIAELAFKFNNVVGALKTLAAAAMPVYESLIGANERLNAQLLASQTNLASSTRIFQANGTEITDPTEKINATRPALQGALKQIEKDTESLVGVTSAQVNDLFQITLTNASELNNQSKEFPDPIAAATQLTKGWAASLKVVGIPLDQARQEINSILKGQVDQNSILAKNLNITNAQVTQWKGQGRLVDELNKRLNVFVAGNAIAARSIDGIGSNIQDVIERVSRQAGEPLLEPTIEALDQVYKFLKDNEIAITDFFKQFVNGGILGAEGIAQGLQPALDEILQFLATSAQFAQSLFAVVTSGLANLSQIAGPVLQFIADKVNFVIGGLNQLNEAILLPQINDAQAAIDEYANSTNSVQDQAIATAQALKNLNDAQKDGGQLSAEQAKKQELLQSSAQGQVAAIDEQIKKYKEIRAISPELQSQVNAEIGALERSKAALSKQAGGLKITGKEAEKLGTSYEQLAQQISSADQVIADGGAGDSKRLADAFKQKTDALTQAVELGTKDVATAIIELEKISADPTATIDAQQKAAEAVTKIRKSELDKQTQDLQTQVDQIEVEAESGKRPPVEAAQEVTALKKRQLDLQIQDVQEAIAREEAAIAAGRGSKGNLKNLQNQQKKLQAQTQKDALDGEKRVQEARYKVIEEQARKSTDLAKTQELKAELETAQLVNKGAITKEEAEARKLKAAQGRIDAELAAEKTRLAALQNQGPAASPALEKDRQAKIRQSQQALLQLEVQGEQNRTAQREAIQKAALAKLEKSQEKANAALSLAEKGRLAEIQKLENAGAISAAEAQKLRLSQSSDRIKAELALEQAKLTELQKLDLPPEEKEKLIRESKLKTADLQLNLLQAEAQAQDAVKQAAQKAIATQAALQKAASDQAVTAIEKQITAIARQEAAQAAITRGLDRQKTLLEAQSGLQQARSNAVVSAGEGEVAILNKAIELRRQLDTETDPGKRAALEQALSKLGANQEQSALALVTQRQQKENQLAQQKLAAIQADQAAQKRKQELDIQSEASAARQQVLAAKRAEIEAQIAVVKAKQAEIDAQAQLAQANLIKDPEERAVALAQAQAAIGNAQQGTVTAQDALGSAKVGVQEAEVEVTAQQDRAALQRESLATQQAAELATFKQSEHLRLVDQLLESANAKAEAMRANLEGAAKASAEIGAGGDPKTPARRHGGAVEGGELYRINDGSGLEAFRDHAGNVTPFFEGQTYFRPSKSGSVLTAAQTAAFLRGRSLSPAIEPNRARRDSLISEVQKLNAAIAGSGGAVQNNTFNVTSRTVVPDVAELHARVSRNQVRWSGL